MGKFCVVFNCKERGENVNLSYHRVPLPIENNPLRTLWLKKIRRRDYIYKPKKNICVCSKHFRDSDFLVSHANGQRHLKKGAVPSQFSWDTFEAQNNLTNIVLDKCLSYNDQSKLLVNNSASIDKNALPNPTNEPIPTFQEEIVPSGSVTNSQVEPQLTNIDGSGNLEIHDSKELEELKKKVDDLEQALEKANETVKVQTYKLQKTEQLLCEEVKKRSLAEKRLKELQPCLNNIKDNNEAITFYTGLPNYKRVMALYEFLDPGENGENVVYWKSGKNNDNVNSTPLSGRPRVLKPIDQFFMVLMRLRLGLFVQDLADRFGISKSTVSIVCNTWINYMYLQLGQISLWPTRDQIDSTMPEEFKVTYPTTRVIIDASEIKCETSSSLVLQSETYSNYKSTNTYKGIIGISPNGFVTFVSELFTGSISDKELTRRSGFLQLDFNSQDSVMADKGFIIKDLLNDIDVNLNIPPFLKDKDQFSKEDLEETQKIAALRIHVERRIQRIKGWHIYDRPIPISLAPVINQLWTVTAILTNFQKPILKKPNNICSNPELDLSDNFDELECPLDI